MGVGVIKPCNYCTTVYNIIYIMVNGWIRFLKSQDSKKCYGIFKGNQQVEQHQQKQKKYFNL